MPVDALNDYLHKHIPLTKAMQARVAEHSDTSVTLTAPLAPNINHRHTVFGGSASALALLAGWALLHLRLDATDLRPRLVIRKNSVDYTRAISSDFQAISTLTDETQWPRFLDALRKKSIARIDVSVVLTCEEREVGSFSGQYVAMMNS